jgi:hypothetical protein
MARTFYSHGLAIIRTKDGFIRALFFLSLDAEIHKKRSKIMNMLSKARSGRLMAIQSRQDRGAHAMPSDRQSNVIFISRRG